MNHSRMRSLSPQRPTQQQQRQQRRQQQSPMRSHSPHRPAHPGMPGVVTQSQVNSQGGQYRQQPQQRSTRRLSLGGSVASHQNQQKGHRRPLANVFRRHSNDAAQRPRPHNQPSPHRVSNEGAPRRMLNIGQTKAIPHHSHHSADPAMTTAPVTNGQQAVSNQHGNQQRQARPNRRYSAGPGAPVGDNNGNNPQPDMNRGSTNEGLPLKKSTITAMERRLSFNMYTNDPSDRSRGVNAAGNDRFSLSDWDNGSFVSQSKQSALGVHSDHSRGRVNPPMNLILNTNSRFVSSSSTAPKKQSRIHASDLQSLASTTSAAGGALIARLPPDLLARMSIEATNNNQSHNRHHHNRGENDSLTEFDDYTDNGSTVLTSSGLHERSAREKLNALSSDDRTIVLTLQKNWEATPEGKSHPMSVDWYIRFARCSHSYHAAWKVMKKFETRYLNLNIANMEQNILKKVVFEVAGLKCSKGNEGTSFVLCIVGWADVAVLGHTCVPFLFSLFVLLQLLLLAS